MQLLLLLLASFFIAVTVAPVFRHDWWIIRVCDFPRQQIAIGGVLLLSGYIAAWDAQSIGETALLTGLLAAVAYQGYWLWPYTPYAPVQVQPAPTRRPDDRLSVLVANLWIRNRSTEAFFDLVRRTRPDVILTLETDARWNKALRALDGDYPHALRHPLDNAYGMTFHSRYPLHNAALRFRVEEDVPSVDALVELPSGRRVRFIGLHPRPPHPEEHANSTARDAELLLVGEEVEAILDERDTPVVVAGDFNDVPWSYVTLLMRRVSGLLDPRIGRGPFNTFHAHYAALRCPLDHVLHSSHFTLGRLKRSLPFGSDHFALLAELQVEPDAPTVHERPYVDDRMRRHARQEIDALA